MLKKTINLPSFSIFLKEFCRNFINERKRGYEWITSQLHGEPISEKPRGYSSKPFLMEGDRSSQQTQYVLDKPKLFWFENIIRNTCKWTHIYIYQTYFYGFFGWQDSTLQQWHAAQRECSKWATHAPVTVCFHAQMLINMSFGMPFIRRRKPIASSLIMWSSLLLRSFFDKTALHVCLAQACVLSTVCIVTLVTQIYEMILIIYVVFILFEFDIRIISAFNYLWI